ncbi:phage tail tape measure protein [Microbacterium oleivorans]|uniref:phage tail tape measure protein n=1 Tax=Microbacterium oleivorans TaxID=273677 RepID=UPI003411E344
MADNRISILIQAQDNASGVIKGVSKNLDESANESKKSSQAFADLKQHTGALVGVMATAGAGIYGVSRVMDTATDSANKYDAALLGLTSIADHFGQSADTAKKAAQTLASDGLMTVTEAAGGLKNLLASGFSLPEAIQLMNRFKDSAAFNRQAALGFGEAIVGATEGIKNGNSILVDNAGVTKNLSVILEEAGYSAQDLMNATSDASIRQALFNGLLKETAPMVGDAKKLTDTYAGSQARLAAETTNTSRKFGQALQPALANLNRTITPIIRNVGDWIERNPQLATGIALTTMGVLGSLAGLAAFGAGVSLISTGVTALIGTVKALSVALAILNLNPVLLGFTALTLVIAGVATAVDIFSGRSAAASSAIDRQRAAQQALTDANKAAKQAQQELSDALLAKEGADLRVEAATARAKAAVDQYGAESYEARQAAHDLKLALDDQAKANDRLKTSTDSARVAVENQAKAKDTVVRANNEVANSAGKAAGQYKNLADRINQASDAYKKGDMNKVVDATFGVPVTGGKIPGRSIGTNYAPGGPTWINEHGPELVNLPQGAQVTPAWRTRAQASPEAAGGTTNNFYGNIINETAEAADRFFERLDKTQRLAKLGVAS